MSWRRDIYGSTEGKDLNGPRLNLGLGPRSNGLWHCLRSRLITGWSMWVGQPYFISLSQSPNTCPISMWWLIKTTCSIAGCNISLHKMLSLIGNYVTFSKISKQAQKGKWNKYLKGKHQISRSTVEEKKKIINLPSMDQHIKQIFRRVRVRLQRLKLYKVKIFFKEGHARTQSRTHTLTLWRNWGPSPKVY